MDHTIKKYRLTSVGNNLELGKRGGMVKFDLVNSKFQLYQPDKTSLSELEIAEGTNGTSAVTLDQLNGIYETGKLFKYIPITQATTLTLNTQYYLTSNVTATLPDTTNASLGDIIILRSSNAITNCTIDVFDAVTEDIITTASSSSSFLIDTMGEYKFIYAGSSIWEIV